MINSRSMITAKPTISNQSILGLWLIVASLAFKLLAFAPVIINLYQKPICNHILRLVH